MRSLNFETSAPRLLVGCCLALTLTSGCSQKVLSIFFDGVESEPLPPTTKVRENLLAEIQTLERELAATKQALDAARKARDAPVRKELPAETAKTWSEASEILPKHPRTGQIDWNEALRGEAILPRFGVEPDAPAKAVLDFDVRLARTGSGFAAVTYAHADHTTWLTCGNCHPAIFPLEEDAPKPVITMDKIRAGEYCGVCHGRVAFGVEGACSRCHPNMSDLEKAG